MSDYAPDSMLLFRSAEHLCALGLSHVVEIMRPQPVQKLENAPDLVCGLSIIRGMPVPVVALSKLFGGAGGPPGRLVVIRAGERQVALAVDAVLGVRKLDPLVAQGLPPLVRDAAGEAIKAVGALDAHLLFVLNSATIVPDGIWQKLASREP